eukprot:295694-Rhodomonas_salina.1
MRLMVAEVGLAGRRGAGLAAPAAKGRPRSSSSCFLPRPPWPPRSRTWAAAHSTLPLALALREGEKRRNVSFGTGAGIREQLMAADLHRCCRWWA